MPRLVLAAWPPASGAWEGTKESAGAATAELLLACSLAGTHTTAPGELQGWGEQTERITVIPACSVDLHNGRLWPMDVKTLLLNCKCLSQA